MQFYPALLLITILLSSCVSYQSARQSASRLPPEQCEEAIWDAWKSANAWGSSPSMSILDQDLANCYKDQPGYEQRYNAHRELANKSAVQDSGGMGDWAPTVSLSKPVHSVNEGVVATNLSALTTNKNTSISSDKTAHDRQEKATNCITQAAYGGENIVNICSSPVLVFWCTEGGGFEACQMYKDRQIQKIGLAAMKDEKYDVGFVEDKDITVLHPQHSMTHFNLGVCPYPGKIKVRFQEHGLDYTYECWR